MCRKPARPRRERDRMVRDVVFGTLFWALVGAAGYVLVGTIEGVALWRVLALAGIGGYIMGYRTRMERERARWRNATIVHRSERSAPWEGGEADTN